MRYRDAARRLAALEGAAPSPPAAAKPLAPEDCAALVTQAAMQNLSLGPDGQVSRRWACAGQAETAELDTALVRLNAELTAAPDPPRTLAALVWLLAYRAPEDKVPPWCWGHIADCYPLEEEGNALS